MSTKSGAKSLIESVTAGKDAFQSVEELLEKGKGNTSWDVVKKEMTGLSSMIKALSFVPRKDTNYEVAKKAAAMLREVYGNLEVCTSRIRTKAPSQTKR